MHQSRHEHYISAHGRGGLIFHALTTHITGFESTFLKYVMATISKHLGEGPMVSGGIPAIDTKERWICFKIGERVAPCHPGNISKIHRRDTLRFREIWCEASLEAWMRKETMRIEIP